MNTQQNLNSAMLEALNPEYMKNEDGQAQSLFTLLAETGRFDPQKLKLLEMVSLNSQDEDLDEASGGSTEDSIYKSKRKLHVVKKLRKALVIMREELEDLQDTNEILAAALGACPECWGENPHCQICEGGGHSGFRMPDSELFEQFVRPAINRLESKGSTTELKQEEPNIVNQEPNLKERKR